MPITEDAAAGEFSATPKIDFIDTPGAPNRNVRVMEDFTFTQATDGTAWEAPSGSIVNGASIPRVLWSLVGSPFTGDYVYASIVHDVACDTRARPWRDTHYMFYLACLAGGTRPGRAKLMYLAVRNFGPRWPQPAPVPAAAEQLAFSALVAENPIETFAAPFSSHAQQLRYLQRAQAYIAAHGDAASIEAIDVHASRLA
ncbi:MAG: DUF1353 domain-containing protein [Hymenobacter sp.]|nr:MAG: DUF1353 domain-containing protein [Hymenobacter sp.]